jgi:hypothetical protein
MVEQGNCRVASIGVLDRDSEVQRAVPVEVPRRGERGESRKRRTAPPKHTRRPQPLRFPHQARAGPARSRRSHRSKSHPPAYSRLDMGCRKIPLLPAVREKLPPPSRSSVSTRALPSCSTSELRPRSAAGTPSRLRYSARTGRPPMGVPAGGVTYHASDSALSLVHVPMRLFGLVTRRRQPLPDLTRYHHRPVLPSRATDRNRQISLALADVMRNQIHK